MRAARIIIRNAALAGTIIMSLSMLASVINPSALLLIAVSDVFPLLLSLAGALLAYSITFCPGKNRLGMARWLERGAWMESRRSPLFLPGGEAF
ncbi:MAG: hypothetical protein WBM17_10005 [Anaerolineales bacterium]